MLWQQSASQVQCAVSHPEQELPVRLLLWAPNGAGLHYNGPGMNAFRLLSNLTPADPLTVALAHGYPSQSTYDVFTKQHFVAPVNGSIASQAAFIWHGCRWLSRQRGRFDVFYGLQAFDFTVRPAIAAQKVGIPAIVKVVQHRADLADRSGWRRLLSRARNRREQIADLSGVVAISDAIFEELVEYGVPERKIARIPNGVDTDRFQPGKGCAESKTTWKDLGWKDEPTILFVGVISPRKRPHLLVQALGLLKSWGISAQLVLAGPVKDPRYSLRVRQLIEELGLSDKVVWTGFVPDIAGAYRAADIFSLPSSNEGMPNALLEAMASGLPSVVTGIPGSSDLVRHGQEAIVVEATASSVADALKQYLLSPKLETEHGAAARKRAVEMFGAKRILQRHIDLYQRVIQGKDAADS
jgi:glycosyltransferase involved in cell wall biosynthesis